MTRNSRLLTALSLASCCCGCPPETLRWPEWRGPARTGVSSARACHPRGRRRARTGLEGQFGGRSSPVVRRSPLLQPMGSGPSLQNGSCASTQTPAKLLWEHKYNLSQRRAAPPDVGPHLRSIRQRHVFAFSGQGLLMAFSRRQTALGAIARRRVRVWTPWRASLARSSTVTS